MTTGTKRKENMNLSKAWKNHADRRRWTRSIEAHR
jgi:hypothetical protein